jgi:hypothetical protein
MVRLYLSRRNLQSLLNKLDRNVKEPGSSACMLVKNDTLHPHYPASHKDIQVIAVEDSDYYIDREPGVVHPADEPK